MSNRLIEINKKRGVIFYFNETIEEIVSSENDRFHLTTSKQQQLEVDKIYNVAGRVAQFDELQLENARVAYGEKGIIVNEYLQTSQETIFVCGDCSNAPAPKLANYAVLQAEYVVNFLFKKILAPIQYPIQAFSTFSNPRIAQTGITVEEAQKNPQNYRVESFDISSWLDPKRKMEREALLKLVIQLSDERVVGATALSQEADILINYITMALHACWSKEELKKHIYAYPSIANELERFWKN